MPSDFQYFKGLNPKKKESGDFAPLPPQPGRPPANPEGYQEFAQAFNPQAQEALNELFRAFNESGQDNERVHTSALIGNNDGPIGMQTLHIQRGKPEGTVWPNGSTAGDSLEEQYHEIRRISMEDVPPNPPYHDGIPGYDNGPLEQAFFVLVDDCTNAEWNTLMNCGGLRGDNLREEGALIIWNLRKITFAQLVERVRNMVVAPPDPNLKYHWYDRTD